MNLKYLIVILVIIIVALGGYSGYMIQYSSSLNSQLNAARSYENSIAANYGLIPVKITLARVPVSINYSAVSSYIFSTPRAGIEVPKDPANYTMIMHAFQPYANITAGTFTFMAGTLEGVPVVINIQDASVSDRSYDVEEMATLFNLSMVIFPGTAGAQLPPSEMKIGDIVIGARLVPDSGLTIYSNPTLVKIASMAAVRVAKATSVPAWVNNGTTAYRPSVFYFGTQKPFAQDTNLSSIIASSNAYHITEEDGDYPSALVVTITKSHPISFVVISTISSSVFEYLKTKGIPNKPHGAMSAAVIAQNTSDNTLLTMLEIMHQSNITEVPSYSPTQSYFPLQWYSTPTNSQTLLSNSSLPL